MGARGGPYTGRCSDCGSSDLWDDNLAYGCNKCGWSSVFGSSEPKSPRGPYTGRCTDCGSANLWDDNLAWGCNACGWSSAFGSSNNGH